MELLLADELDAHLHPFWQRTILPAILDIGELLDERLQMQVVVSTHSPFVLASLETRFDPASDALYHMHLDGATVRLKREEFYKHGDVSSWLTAPIFGLRYAGSKDAEHILDQAVQLQAKGLIERRADGYRARGGADEGISGEGGPERTPRAAKLS